MAEGWKRNTENSSDDAVPGRSEQNLCQPCSSKDINTAADVFCSSCNEFQCTKCSDVHNAYAFMKGHKLVNAKEGKSKQDSFDLKGLDQCELHHELLKFLCEDDDKLCCSTCAIVNHRKCHSVVEIQTIAQQFRSTSPKLKTKLQEVKSKAEKVVKHTQSSKEQLQHDTEEIPKKISSMQAEVNKIFEDLKSSVTREAKAFRAKTEEKLTKKQTTSEKHVAEVTKSLETIDNINEKGTPAQQFIVEHKLKDKVNELYTKVEETCRNLETVTVSFDFDQTLKLTPRPISDYIPGQLTLKYSVSDTLKSIVHVDPIVKLEKITSIDLKKTGDDVGEPLYSGLDFLSDGRLVAVDNTSKKCLIFNEKLEKVGSYQLSYIPQGVVAVSGEQVAITSGGKYQVDFLRVSKSNVITLIRTCKVKTKYASICMKDDGNFVVGAIDATRPVRIVSLSGEEKDFSINFSDKKYPIGTSACTYIRNSDKVVLTDRYEHTVYIYDVTTNTRVVVRDDQIKAPLGVAVGPSDCILVCSYHTDSIVQISPTGRVLSSYKLDTSHPYRVCVSQNKSILAVSTSRTGNKKLQLYTLTLV